MRHFTDYRALLLIIAICATSLALAQDQGPSLQILSPEDGTTVQGTSVELRMQVRGVELSPRRSSNSAYALLRLDAAPPLKAYANTFTFQDVAAGNHILRVELRRSDGSAFQPPIRTQVRFAVRAGQD